MSDYNTEIRIYSDFSEIREDYDVPKHFTVTFNLQDYNEILEDTIELEGINVLVYSIESKESNLEGQTIYVKDRDGKSEARKVTLVRNRDMLVKDEETGRFYSCSNKIIEYTSVPIEMVNEIKFVLENSGKATLVYCFRAINWSPKYRLDFEEGNSVLKGFAIIRNNSDRDFFVSGAELIGGDLKFDRPRPLYNGGIRLFKAAAAPLSAPDEIPAVAQGSELGGVFNYQIHNKFHLKGKSQIILPFMKRKIEAISYSSSVNSCNSTHVGKFDRMLELCSDEYIPRGKLSIREKGRFIGFIDLSDVTAKEKKEICVGKDASSFYDRKTKLIKSDKASTVTEVTLTFHNEHNIPWELRYKELINIYMKKVTFETTCDEIELIDSGLKITCAMDKQSTKSVTYTVTEVDIKHKD